MKFRPDRILWLFCLIIAILIVLFPIYMMLKYSISDKSSIVTGGEVIPLWPYAPTLQQFVYIFRDHEFLQAIWASVRVSMLTILFAMGLGVPAAYVLARFQIPGKVVLLVSLISIRLFPDISSVVPVTVVFINLNLVNTVMGAALAHTLLSLPYVIYISMGVFESIPQDLEMQAQILGASKMYSFIRIIFPLAVPGLAAAAIYTFLLSWDEFIFSYFLLGFGEIKTLPVFLKSKMAFSPPQNYLAAISVMLSLPVILFTFFLQKYMKTDVMAGSVK